jgi:hypothetical protein
MNTNLHPETNRPQDSHHSLGAVQHAGSLHASQKSTQRSVSWILHWSDLGRDCRWTGPAQSNLFVLGCFLVGGVAATSSKKNCIFFICMICTSTRCIVSSLSLMITYLVPVYNYQGASSGIHACDFVFSSMIDPIFFLYRNRSASDPSSLSEERIGTVL